jgi:hypothetical protein
MRPRWEVLGAEQRRVLERLAPEVDRRGFYLAGGTALALRLGHRESEDFDWFAPSGIDDPSALAADLAAAVAGFHAERVAPGTVHGNGGRAALRISSPSGSVSRIRSRLREGWIVVFQVCIVDLGRGGGWIRRRRRGR